MQFFIKMVDGATFNKLIYFTFANDEESEARSQESENSICFQNLTPRP